MAEPDVGRVDVGGWNVRVLWVWEGMWPLRVVGPARGEVSVSVRRVIVAGCVRCGMVLIEFSRRRTDAGRFDHRKVRGL